MILDSSAIVALLLDEPERADFGHLIGMSDRVGVGAPTLVESAIVLSTRFGTDAQGLVSAWLRASDIVVVDFDVRHWEAATTAWSRYGKGRHPARLNLGDCLAYATARVARRPLLAKGNDFALTDLDLVARPGTR